MLTPHDHLELLDDGVARFRTAVAGVDPSAPVPSCEGWSVADLVDHVAGVHRFVQRQLDAGPGADLVRERPQRPDRVDAFDWFVEGADHLVATLRTLDPAEHRPNWAGQPTSAFWFRRMAQEMAVHCWDAEAAAGEPAPLDTTLAVDGVDEFLEHFVGRIDLAALGVADGTTFHLHATDADGEWLVTVGSAGVEWRHGHAKGDVAARGRASDLLLFVWGRLTPSDLEVFGAADLLDRWHTHVKI